jgi:hypothetical protein
MLFVVVARALSLIVVSLMLFSTVSIVLPTGTLAPPYHLNLVYKATSTTYVYRGGTCSNGFACGFAYVHLYFSFSNASWGYGAALSFKL